MKRTAEDLVIVYLEVNITHNAARCLWFRPTLPGEHAPGGWGRRGQLGTWGTRINRSWTELSWDPDLAQSSRGL